MTRVVAFRPALLGIIFFLIPIVGVLFLIAANQEVVPRDAARSFFNELDKATSTRSPAVLAQIYHMAIAGALTALIAIAVIFQFSRWQAELLKPLREMGLGALVPLLALASLFPVVRAIQEPGFIDDEAVKALFEAAGLLTLKPRLLFGDDARILGALIFTAYSVGAATASLAAICVHASRPSEQDAAARRLMSIVRGTLLLTSLVLLGAVVTAKLRLDVGALMLLGPAAEAYRTIAGGIMNYWAVVLSAGLAMIYFAPAMHLYQYLAPREPEQKTVSSEEEKPGKNAVVAHIPWLTEENLGRLARLLAVLSPPLINSLAGLLLPTAS